MDVTSSMQIKLLKSLMSRDGSFEVVSDERGGSGRSHARGHVEVLSGVSKGRFRGWAIGSEEALQH